MNTVVNLLLIAACAYAIFVLYVTHKWLKEHSESINILNETILRRLPKEEDDDEEEVDELDEVYVVLRARILFTSDAKLTSEDLLVTKWLRSCAVMSSVPIKSIHS